MTDGGDAWSDANVVNVSGVSSSIAANTYDAKYNPGGTLTKPGTDGGGVGNLRWGPANMQFTAVPEPATYGLIGAGMLALAAGVRRRNKLVGKVS